jgi:Flp pilus assembly pilin Flp
MNMRGLFSEFLADERGAHAIEYGLLAVGILVALIAAAAALGSVLDASPDHAGSALN